MRVGSDYLEFLDALLSKHDLLHGRWITLILLMREPDRAALPSVLAEKQGVSRATMSGLLEGLEADGLIERVSDEADARRSLAKLTRRGVSRLDKVMPVYYRAVSGLMSAYSNSQRKQLLELLRAAPAPE
jgi:DNA-binding MarR family transcriptional regulator